MGGNWYAETSSRGKEMNFYLLHLYWVFGEVGYLMAANSYPPSNHAPLQCDFALPSKGKTLFPLSTL